MLPRVRLLDGREAGLGHAEGWPRETGVVVALLVLGGAVAGLGVVQSFLQLIQSLLIALPVILTL